MQNFIEGVLTAHPAWEFVETVTQVYERFHSGASTYYPSETYTCRVWKNLGTVNGYGKDFYVAIITMNVMYVDDANYATQSTAGYNAMWFLPFEEWNTSLKRMRKPAGVDFWKYGTTGSTDIYLNAADNYSMHGNQWSNLVEAQLADDSATTAKAPPKAARRRKPSHRASSPTCCRRFRIGESVPRRW